MKPEYLYGAIACLVVLGFVAYLVKDRLRLFTVKWGNKSATIQADERGPGIRLSGVEAGQNVTAVDETGSGIHAEKIKSGGDAVFRNEAQKKRD
jgi:hypothetical protein